MIQRAGALAWRRAAPRLLAVALAIAGGEAAAATLMRFPTTSATQVAFVAAGDLWTAPLAGGAATRLTHDPGDIVAPHFSPDGRMIAFTARRARSREVYVVPSVGGEARRLTFDGPGQQGDNLVLGWTPDGRHVLFLSSHGAPNLQQFRAFEVPHEGGLPVMLPIDHAGLLFFSPDGRAIVYEQNFRSFELRKRYIGGQQQDIFTDDLATGRRTRIAGWKGEDSAPMWAGRTIYFVSDRGAGYRANLWAFDLDTKRTRQITFFTDYDLDWPSLGQGGISFQQGGSVYALDLPTERLREIHIEISGNDERTRPRFVAAAGQARVSDALGGVDYGLSPDGSALLISARGDIVRASLTNTPLDLTQTPDADEDHPSWSPDGRLIAYTTDWTGEQQVVVRPVAGGPERALTHAQHGYYFSAVWSPAGDRLAVPDADHGLWLVPIGGGEPEVVARDPYAAIRDAAFSPDGHWLAYSTQRATRMRAIHLRELASGHDTVVSSAMESDRLPAFTPDGRYLAFVSQRNEQPFVSDRGDESVVATLNSDGIYLVPLGAADPAPSAASGRDARPNGPVKIDLAGLMTRAVALPVTPAVITALQSRGSDLFYQTKPPQLIGGDLPGAASALHAFDLAMFSDRKIVDGLDSYSLAANGTAVAFRKGGAWRIAPTRGDAADGHALDLGTLRIRVEPRREWSEMLQNAWRLDRDVFFNPLMNGTRWQAVHDAYARLWPLIGSQDDFLYLLGQLQGEIGSSHTFIGRGAEFDPRPAVATPLLGADYVLDAAAGRYRFSHIYRGDQSRPDLRGPLGAPGLDVREGDYLVAVNGRELRPPAAPFSIFAGLEGPLHLTLARTADGARRVITVEAVDDDWAIRHLDWVERNRRLVDRQSDGRLGYIALSDFDDEGSKEFVRQFYPQLDKRGLIIDIRWNSGGFTSQAVLEVLRRQAAGVFVNRNAAVSPLPVAAPPSVMAVVMNAASRSDGDQFPFFFRQFGLGPLIGERTWGGVQGINGPWRLMDGSFVTIPKDALADRSGRWIIENAGVRPDIPVDDDGGADDAPLRAAVLSCLDRLERNPSVPLQAPAWLPAYPAAGNVPGAAFGANPVASRAGPLPRAHRDE